MSTSQQTRPARHPLDPLTAGEFRRVAGILRRDRGVGPRWRFASIELREPDKDTLRSAGPGRALPREALAVCWDRDTGHAYCAVVSLASDSVLSWTPLPGQQPNITVDEWHECDEMLRADPRLAAALGRRGITGLSRILTDLWAYPAATIPPRYRGLRLGWADVWYRRSEQGSPYAHHLSGLHPIVDLNRMALLEIEDGSGPGTSPGLPQVMGEYLPKLIPQPLRHVAPLQISQPAGVSFSLDGHLLSWQNWEMRLGFNYREGLVLHAVGFRDAGRLRPVAHRLSFAEMVVPYRDPTVDHYRRTAFDIGEWGLGFMTTSLQLGCDCLGEITYLDAVVHDSAGEPQPIPHAICIHEEDNGVLWKHVDHQFGAEVRRARRLVVSFHVTVANYEYLVYWRFYQDGNIECEVRATGIMVTSNFPAGQQPPYGTLVDERTYAPFHQHFIVARLDLDVDGPDNTVYAVDSAPCRASEDDPYQLGLVLRQTPLRSEAEGQQDYDWHTQRSWKVVNDTVRNGLGTPVGYKLVPGGCFPAMLGADSPVLERARAIGHTLWVTPYHPDERWPCGEFPTFAAADAGLGAWTAQNRPIENTDVVLWYVFGIHHLTRPEDWPIMPVDTVSFWLKPSGFFDRNPALDVPPDSACPPGQP
ncbi:MAG TPA: primary-amine oxidase [Streptosporangiaceae bacterium]|nr:primary-amine oxidase [Streptosporangiaceae bacterium]